MLQEAGFPTLRFCESNMDSIHFLVLNSTNSVLWLHIKARKDMEIASKEHHETCGNICLNLQSR